jgi:outer membrane protein assembly factor BamA
MQNLLVCPQADETVSVCVDWGDRYSKLDHKFIGSINLVKTTFDSDIPFSKDEFSYLTGLVSGSVIDIKQLKNACFYLEQRNLFSRICIALRNCENGKALHFSLVGYKRLGNVRVEGVLFGKDRYRRMYGIEEGSKFNQAKHEFAVKRVLSRLKSEGYLGATVESRVECDLATKLVTVFLTVHSGDQFTISSIKCSLQDPVGNDCSDCDLMGESVVKLLKNRLVGNRYSKVFLKKQVKFFKKHFARSGYPFAQIKCDILKNKVKKQIEIVFNVFLRQKQCYQFFGNAFYANNDLLDYIMFSGDPIWHLPISLVVKDLIDLYRNNGFWQVEIDAIEEQDCYKFLIKEGARSIIKKASIKGLDSFSSKQFSRRFFSKVLISKFYNKKILDRAISEITDWFIQNGFWDFKVLSTDFKVLKKNNVYELVVVVDEGQRRFLRSAVVTNHQELCLPFSRVRGDLPFKSCYLQAQKDWMQGYFASKGYCNITVYPRVRDESGDVLVEWDVKFDQPALLGKTVRRGNGKILFNNLYKRLPYKEGETWDKQKLEDAFFHIKNLDAFDSIRVYPATELDINGKKPILLHLNLDNKLEFRTRLGFQKVSKNFVFKSGATYKVGVSALYKNMTNRGDQLRFDADFTRYYRSVVAQYKVPVFIKIPLYFATKVYTNKYDQPIFIGSKKRLYSVCQQGALIDIGYKGRALNTGVNFGFEGVRVGDISKEYAAAIDFSDSLLSKQVPFIFIEPTMLLDYLDDKLNPRKGILTLATFKGMFAMGREQSYFLKFLLEQSAFVPMFHKSTLAMRFRFGHIFTNNFDVIMPIERFYLGGANSLRSFEPDFAPPLGTVKVPGEDNILVPQGGKTMINAIFEFRFPVYKNFGIVLFQDIGTLLKKGTNLGEGELLVATGFGLRYMTPVGPLRFDIGWRPRRFEADSNFAWFLTVGHTF